MSETGVCNDVDECSLDSPKCDKNAICSNTVGSFKCECSTNYFGNGLYCVEGQCNDVNCPENEKCVSPNSIECECIEGYSFNQFMTCTDIDECLLPNACDINAECTNAESSYSCKCKPGLIGDGKTCQCPKGFEFGPNGKCADIDECSQANECDVNAECTNSDSTYSCKCRSGSFGNGKSCDCANGFSPDLSGKCVDIDECSLKNRLKHFSKTIKKSSRLTRIGRF